MKSLPSAFGRLATGRLALSYLAIMVVLSLGFSFAFYHASVSVLYDRSSIAPVSIDDKKLAAADILTAQQGLLNKIDDLRTNLKTRLVLFNAGVIAGGSVLSYFLARRTLRPVEAAMEAQSRFASDASHELRTPLAIMQAENEEALDMPGLPRPAKRLISSNLEEIARLRALSDNLLQLARTDEPLQLQPVWADEIASEAINRIVKAAQARHVAIDDAWPHVQVMANEAALVQITLALLDNAIKYSSARSTVYLEGEQSQGSLRLSIRDTGMGISAKNLPYIFDRFYRGESGQAGVQPVAGHGLGLSIARKLIAEQKGIIDVTSAPGKGSAFIIILPVAST